MAQSVSEAAVSEERTYGIRELADEFGITTRTIRFYEDHGLLRPRREGQRRIYSRGDRVRLKLTLRGKRLGMSLPEIREIFDLYDTDIATGGNRQLRHYLKILGEKRELLLQQRRDIDEALAELEESARRCEAILAERGEHQT